MTFLVRHSFNPSETYFETDNQNLDEHAAEAAVAQVPPHIFEGAKRLCFELPGKILSQQRYVYRYYLYPVEQKECSKPKEQTENREQQVPPSQRTIQLTGELLLLSKSRLSLLREQMEHYEALALTTKKLYDVEADIHKKSMAILKVNQQ